MVDNVKMAPVTSIASAWHVIEGSVGRSPRDMVPPNLPYGHLPRPRLIAMIERPFRPRVTLIVAGAGYGKTILATELAAQLDVQVGWLTLSESDNDDHALIEDLRVALRPCLRRGRLAPPPEMTDDHDLLERDLADIEQGNCLILDNCEILTNPACHQVLSDVVTGLPDRCSIVLISRTTPRLPLGKLRASGMLREIGPSHLPFTRAETAAFLAGLPDVRLESDETQQVHHFTQGWAVGLYLVSVAARAHELTLFSERDRHPVFHQFVDEYVHQELLAPLSKSSRAFLLATIELPTINPDICAQALGTSDTSDRIAEFIREFPFIVPVPAMPSHWAWPRMIRESLLRITNATAHRATMTNEQSLILSLLFQKGALRDAADYALIGGDPEWVAAAVRPWCEHLALRSDFEPLGTLLSQLPEASLETHPDFLYWRAIAHLGIARHLSVLEWFAPVEQAWMTSGDPLLRGRALTCRCLIAWLSGLHPEAIATADAALATLPQSATTERMYAATTKARVLFREGDDDGAALANREAEHLAALLPIDEQWAWRSLAMDRANAYAMRGDLHSAVTKYRLIISELPESLRFLEGFYRCRLIGLAIEQGKLDLARHEYGHVERLLEGEWRFWHIWAIVARTRLLIAEEAFGDAEAWATQHVKVMRRMPGKSQLIMQLARVWLHHGEYAMVRSWLNDLRDLPFPWIDAFGEVSQLQMQVDLDLAEGHYEAAETLAASLTAAAERMSRWSEFIVFSVRWALALSLLGETNRVLPVLTRAVHRGDRGGFVQAYDVAGFTTSSLIAEARQANAAGKPADALSASAASSHTLTRREHEVLLLVSRGRTNQQIAAELYISVNTVRNHLVHICRRLDANSRVEAVAKARDLGLLS
ncbi:MAG: LuxR C-terminal-related transcriptional regulator [Thermomicrobiales bacterium]